MLRAALKMTNMRHWWNGNDREKPGLKLIYYIFKGLGGACSTYVGEEAFLQDFGGAT
jgi:hypothetical protein